MSRIATLLFVAVLAVTGCKEKGPPAKAPAEPARPAPAAAPVPDPEPAPDPAPDPEPEAWPQPEAEPTAPPEKPAASDPGDDKDDRDDRDDVALKAPRKPNGTICKRACNKAQQCGSARGGVVVCVGGCMEALRADPKTSPDLAVTALGFLAQEKCADVRCTDFKGCLAKALAGEQAMAAAPAIARNAARALCQKLCAKEEDCQHGEQKRISGVQECLDTCEAVQVSPQPDMAAERVLMGHALGCVEKPCEEFAACARAAMLSAKD